MPYLVVLIHGISSRGDWQDQVAAVFDPMFVCARVRYREYHALGAVKIFFCPWALLLAGLLLAFLTERAAPGGQLLLVAAGAGLLLLAGALFEALAPGERSWIRAAPWLLLLGWLAVCLTLRAAGVAAAETILALAVAALAVHVAYHEWDWTRLPFLPLVPLAAGGLAFYFWLGSLPRAADVLAAALGFLILFQEFRECDGGGDTAALWRCALAAAAAAALALAYFGWLAAPEVQLALVALLLLAGRWEPTLRLDRALEKVEVQVNEARHRHGSGHLIAHSLGTCLSGHYFVHRAQLSWHQVILIGGALSEEFDWTRLVHDDEGQTRIRQVRNEHGGRDPVIRLLTMAGAWGRRHHLGTAGFTGLRHREGRPPVHSVADVREACARCAAPARLHNYLFTGYRHSDYFIAEHARLFWLASLLGLTTRDYADFVEACRAASHYRERGNTVRYRAMVQLLAERRWAWMPPARTLAEYSRECLREELARLEPIAPAGTPSLGDLVAGRVAEELVGVMAEAERARLAPTEENRIIREAFDPTQAISRASEAALRAALPEWRAAARAAKRRRHDA
jgi:hypothetical protein